MCKQVCNLTPSCLPLPQLPCPEDDLQHSLLIGLLVALLEATRLFPASSGSYVHIRSGARSPFQETPSQVRMGPQPTVAQVCLSKVKQPRLGSCR